MVEEVVGKLPSHFSANSTAEEVARNIRLDGKNVLVTGANTGIGKECCRVLYKMGANVYLLCRNVQKGEEAKAEILKGSEQKDEQRLVVMMLDLSSLNSVREFCNQWANVNLPIHVLLNNAGVMACPRSTTVDGFEMQFGTNHLGHFLLTNLLIPYLKEARNSRVINVSSIAHTGSAIRFDVCGKTNIYDEFFGDWKAYSISKTANILFSVELDRRYKSDGIRSNSLHPGSIGTDLGRNNFWASTFYSLVKSYIKSIPQGAATSIVAATATELEGVGGKYFVDCQYATPKDYAIDPDTASQLWELSAKWVKLY
jgi:NAD(P)-dependent dehydrogenase (short-subunit alcohol dehydrogenase family)